MRIFDDVLIVIDVDKSVMDDWIVESKSERHKQQAQNRDALLQSSKATREEM